MMARMPAFFLVMTLSAITATRTIREHTGIMMKNPFLSAFAWMFRWNMRCARSGREQVGVGLGGTFDKAALLAKKALLRETGGHTEDPFYAELERELLERINALGIGPQGFGGRTTALAVHMLSMPTHIAGLPVAVNINCHVARHRTEVL